MRNEIQSDMLHAMSISVSIDIDDRIGDDDDSAVLAAAACLHFLFLVSCRLLTT